ncbi:hypothetical protein CUC15_06770 [Oceanobacillus zhaokaii]|uniref:NADP-dependent oxidoreductase domain-containing protein n=1 Tax=Oceanobacillus zhaokaii TaxID=2052660 RepID=A0A345PF52_9BACI|nr:aldo/keto reductase [Oceanobacillus zhaokaii]AXI08632.1 hypothetical protein CUC15_06770 [Oceanobacillus zhaokaii]
MIYGLGRSEELVGEVLKEFKRDEFVVATKGAQHWYEDGTVKTDNRPEYLREAVEKSIDNNISFIPYGPLSFGLLSGSFTKDFKLDAQDWRQLLPLFQGEQFQQAIETVDKLKEFAVQKEISLPNLALAWLLAQDGVDAVIPGGKRKERIRENVQASKIGLSKEELNTLEDILSSY